MPNPNPSPGRPRSLNEIKRREICALVSAGCGIRQAARYVQCAPSTINREAQRDPQFLEQLRRAEMAAQLNPLHAMQRAVATHWRAAAWFLERTDPERFSRRDPRAFTPKQVRALAGDMIDIVHKEIFDPMLSDRLVRRIKAAIDFAMHSAWDANRTRANLRRAMRLFSEKDRANRDRDPFEFQDSELEAFLGPASPSAAVPPPLTAPAKRPAVTSSVPRSAPSAEP